MSETRELVAVEPAGEITPQAIVDRAQAQAKALMGVVEKAGLYQQIGDKKFLTVEAWVTILRFNNASPAVEWVRPVEREGTLVGYEARVNILRQGQVEASGEAMCGLDEYVCRGKEGLAAENACRSMAQTRATSKAARLAYSFVAVLANYAPTPAEEMGGESPQPTMPQGEERELCPVHKVPFVHRVGTSAKGPYDFWACPKKVNGEYCKAKPQKTSAPTSDDEPSAEELPF